MNVKHEFLDSGFFLVGNGLQRRFWEDLLTWGEHCNVHGLRTRVLGEVWWWILRCTYKEEAKINPGLAPPLEVNTYSCLFDLDWWGLMMVTVIPWWLWWDFLWEKLILPTGVPSWPLHSRLGPKSVPARLQSRAKTLRLFFPFITC
jgi:hypothetical protein